MLRYSLTSLDSNKPISAAGRAFRPVQGRPAHNIRVLVDSFDLVEQALGHPIHLPRMVSFA